MNFKLRIFCVVELRNLKFWNDRVVENWDIGNVNGWELETEKFSIWMWGKLKLRNLSENGGKLGIYDNEK